MVMGTLAVSIVGGSGDEVVVSEVGETGVPDGGEARGGE